MITVEEVPQLLNEVAAVVHREELKKIEDLDMVYSKMLKMKEQACLSHDGQAWILHLHHLQLKFPSQLAERDFSLMKTFVGDPAQR